jgi:anti-sigma factor RsiW
VKPERFHPADDRLIAVYFGDEEASADDRRAVRQHLHGCEACTWRYTELTAPLERLRQDAASEADEVFTPARLDRQLSRILDRVEGAADEPKVIPFPSSGVRFDRSFIRRPLSRWVAAAAAAGLLLGVMAGRLFESGAARFADSQPPVVRTTVARAVISAPAQVFGDDDHATEVDELALSEIDEAVHTQRIAALSTLDEVTPHIRPEAMIARARAMR